MFRNDWMYHVLYPDMYPNRVLRVHVLLYPTFHCISWILNVSDESESKENIEDVGVSEIVKECEKYDLRTLVKVKRGKETEYTINYDGKHENHH